MDHGIWAIWYDLDDDVRDAHLAWAHSTYLPYLRQFPGVAWVAHYEFGGEGPDMMKMKKTGYSYTDEPIGHGIRYLILVGAASPHTFFYKPGMTQMDLPPGFAEMLAQRKGERTAAFAEEARVTGPAYGLRAPGSTPGPAIQFGTLRLRTLEDEFEIGRWYAQYRMPHMAKMPGSICTRKLLGVAGWAKHGILYEYESIEMRLKHFEEAHEALGLERGQWTSRIVNSTIHTPGSPWIGSRIWPSVK